MIAAPYICAADVLRVTAEARVQDLIQLQLREGDDILLSTLGINMILARSMATLATGIFSGDIRDYGGLIVRISEKSQCDVRMTGPAAITSRITGIRVDVGFRGWLAGQRKCGAQRE